MHINVTIFNSHSPPNTEREEDVLFLFCILFVLALASVYYCTQYLKNYVTDLVQLAWILHWRMLEFINSLYLGNP